MADIINLTPQQLRRAADIQERILELQKQLEQLLGAPAKVANPAGITAQSPGRRRRRMSPAARARLAAAARERWKKAKAAGRSKL